MKIVFFSDAHGNQYAVEEFFRRMRDENPDLIVYGGDVFGYYYGQYEILSMLSAHNCVQLLGNHDQYFLNLLDGKITQDHLITRYGKTYKNIIKRIPENYVDRLRRLSSRYNLSVDGLSITFVHGSIDDPMNGRIYPNTHIEDLSSYKDIDYVFMGHTHHKLSIELNCGTYLINPGSIGQQRDGKGCAYGVFDTISKEYDLKTINYDVNRLINEIDLHNETVYMHDRLIEVLFRRSER